MARTSAASASDVGQAVVIEPGERVFIGPYAMVVAIEGDTIRAYVEQDKAEWGGNQVEVEALDLFLEVPDRPKQGQEARPAQSRDLQGDARRSHRLDGPERRR